MSMRDVWPDFGDEDFREQHGGWSLEEIEEALLAGDFESLSPYADGPSRLELKDMLSRTNQVSGRPQTQSPLSN